MKKIAIIGSGGAGKSTLARKLGTLLNIPVFHLDAIFWKPGWVPIERENLTMEQNKIINKPTWIIDGNYGSTMDMRLQEADTVIFLHYATMRCLYRITKRRIQYHGKTRPDMGADCPEKLDFEFFQWVRKFNQTKAPAMIRKLAHLKDTKVLVFKNPKELNYFLSELEQEHFQHKSNRLADS